MPIYDVVIKKVLYVTVRGVKEESFSDAAKRAVGLLNCESSVRGNVTLDEIFGSAQVVTVELVRDYDGRR